MKPDLTSRYEAKHSYCIPPLPQEFDDGLSTFQQVNLYYARNLSRVQTPGISSAHHSLIATSSLELLGIRNTIDGVEAEINVQR